MRPLYIFDLDGTLALTEHRQHMVQCEKPDWRAFFAACVHDQPNEPVVKTMLNLWRSGADVAVWSGRSNEVHEQTVQWFDRHGIGYVITDLRMRAAGDFTPDEVLKKRWLDDMAPGYRERLVAIFDDRAKVVSMWRAAGVPCFQVAEGNF